MSKEFSGEDTAKFSSDMVAGQPPTLTPEESAALAALPCIIGSSNHSSRTRRWFSLFA